MKELVIFFAGGISVMVLGGPLDWCERQGRKLAGKLSSRWRRQPDRVLSDISKDEPWHFAWPAFVKEDFDTHYFYHCPECHIVISFPDEQETVEHHCKINPNRFALLPMSWFKVLKMRREKTRYPAVASNHCWKWLPVPTMLDGDLDPRQFKGADPLKEQFWTCVHCHDVMSYSFQQVWVDHHCILTRSTRRYDEVDPSLVLDLIANRRRVELAPGVYHWVKNHTNQLQPTKET